MEISELHKETFKKGSKTYFNSSIFFPEQIRNDVFVLYGFVRIADDFVDAIPPNKEDFHVFVEKYHDAIDGEPSGDHIIDSFIQLIDKRGFDPEWVTSFLKSMEMDLYKKNYDTLDETIEYMYGSAETIGMFMARIMELPEEALESARMLGRAMQFINFIRDIAEDLSFGRRYLPLEGYSLESLHVDHVSEHVKEFSRFITDQVGIYIKWQEKAESGFKYIPRRYLIPIKTASDMYKWTAMRIRRNPMIVYTRKVKPSKRRIIARILLNTLNPRLKK